MILTPQITFAGDLLNVHFDDFGINAYPMFLKVKALPESRVEFNRHNATYTISAPARFAPMLGVNVPPRERDWLPFPAYMFEDQKHVAQLALEAKRFACWSDCGWGKTPLMLEFARQVIHRTGGRFLIITMNSIVEQFITEAKKFYGDELPILRLNSREELKAFCRGDLGDCKLAIVNYEKMNPDGDDDVISEMRLLAGIGLDESSRLKTGGGVQKWALIHSCKGIEYKLSCTATPAPNNAMEFASQASFLEKLRDGEEILWTFFERDPVSHRWRLRKHARQHFFEAMASWSIYIRDPKRYGWRLDQKEVPAPEIIVHQLALGDEQRQAMAKYVTDSSGQGNLFAVNATNAIQRGKLSQIAKGFVYRSGEQGPFKRIHSCKPKFIADGVAAEVTEGLQVLIWTVFDAESTILSEQLTAAGVKHELITGKTKEADRVRLTNEFCDGTLPVLVTRASMLGYGRNFQACGSMWFSGWSDSYESYYQAIRRAVRYGQKRSVRVHLPVIEDLEGDQLDNIFCKQAMHEAAIAEMEMNYIRIIQGRVEPAAVATKTCPQCGNGFAPRRGNQRFCCDKCKWTWNNANRDLKPNVVAECEVCGNVFERYVAPSSVAKGTNTNQYCSRKCKGAALSGPNHPMWKGGSCIVNGYVWTYSPDHPNAKHQGYVLEHRLVMERKLGRLLTREEVVHHKNENTLDNDPDNLELYATHADHMRDHNDSRDRNSLGQYLVKEVD